MVPVKPNGSNTPQLQKMNFPYAPISLTGNHPPEYFLYAFGSSAIGIALIVYLLTFRRAAYSELSDLYEDFRHRPAPMSPSSTSNPVEQSSLQTGETPLRHQVAFWRGHFRVAGGLDSEQGHTQETLGSNSIAPDQANPLMERRCEQKRMLTLITTLVVVALVCFMGQAIVPAQPDTLYVSRKGLTRMREGRWDRQTNGDRALTAPLPVAGSNGSPTIHTFCSYPSRSK